MKLSEGHQEMTSKGIQTCSLACGNRESGVIHRKKPALTSPRSYGMITRRRRQEIERDTDELEIIRNEANRIILSDGKIAGFPKRLHWKKALLHMSWYDKDLLEKKTD